MTSRWIFKELLLCAILIWAFMGPHAQADSWSEGDKWRQGAYTVLHMADWHQTHQISDSTSDTDVNPIMGPSPSDGQIDRYFAGTLIIHYVIAHNLPRDWRKRFQYVTIAVEAGAVAHNWSVGYTIEF